jgi:hypothetical protein
MPGLWRRCVALTAGVFLFLQATLGVLGCQLDPLFMESDANPEAIGIGVVVCNGVSPQQWQGAPDGRSSDDPGKTPRQISPACCSVVCSFLAAPEAASVESPDFDAAAAFPAPSPTLRGVARRISRSRDPPALVLA